MANTYSQIYIQFVFAVQNRDALIHSTWEDRLYKYITGIVQNKKQKMIAINGMPDHIHMLLSLNPDCCPSDLVKAVKISSNEFIKDERLSKFKFNWQEGFGAFSYSKSQMDTVVNYIHKQKDHHKKISFKNEYLTFLKKFQVEYKEEYLFKWILEKY